MKKACHFIKHIFLLKIMVYKILKRLCYMKYIWIFFLVFFQFINYIKWTKSRPWISTYWIFDLLNILITSSKFLSHKVGITGILFFFLFDSYIFYSFFHQFKTTYLILVNISIFSYLTCFDTTFFSNLIVLTYSPFILTHIIYIFFQLFLIFI